MGNGFDRYQILIGFDSIINYHVAIKQTHYMILYTFYRTPKLAKHESNINIVVRVTRGWLEGAKCLTPPLKDVKTHKVIRIHPG